MNNIIKGTFLYLFTDKEQYQAERLDICYQCNEGKSMCPSCGCFVELKTRVKEEVCPIGLWQ